MKTTVATGGLKVGLYLGNTPPDHGGGYTFQYEIFRALLKASARTAHRFVVLSGWDPQVTSGFDNPSVQFVSLQPNLSEQVKPLLSQALLTAVRRRLQRFGIRELPKTWMNPQVPAAVAGIDLLWYPNQHLFLTLEVPYIATIWDVQHRLQPYFPEFSADGQWERRERAYTALIQRAAAVITGTQEGREQIERFYRIAPERIEVVPMPTPHFALDAPTGEDSSRLRRRYNLPEHFLFYPAQFWPHKNHAGLLHALYRLRETDNLPLSVVLVGSDKGNQAHIRQLAHDLKLEQQVHFLGFIPVEDLVGLYRAAFALTFVSLAGPDNLPPLEAFALGCPVIAADVPGAAEQLGNAALRVDPESEAALAGAIKTLWRDPDLRTRLILRGLERGHRWRGEQYVQTIFAVLDRFQSIRRCWS